MSVKRGQITIFIIIGVVLLTATALIIYLSNRQNIEAPQITVPETAEGITTQFVQSCLAQSSEGAVVEVGRNGGFATPVSPPSITWKGENIALHYYNNLVVAPTEDEMTTELTLSLTSKFFDCVGNYSTLAEQGIAVNEEGGFDINITHTSNDMRARIEYPLIIKQGDVETKLSTFAARTPTRIYTFRKSAERVAEAQDVVKFGFCLSCLFNEAVINGYTYNVDAYPGIYIIRLNDMVTDEEFRYALEVQDPTPITIFRIKPVQAQALIVGEPYELQIKAEGTNIKFSDDTELFDITTEGLIKFTPAKTDIGTHFTTITAEADEGKDTTKILFKIGNAYHTPLISPQMTITGKAGEPIEYAVPATDLDGNILTYTLTKKLAGMEVSNGVFKWTPPSTGTFEAAIEVANDKFKTESKITIIVE